MDQNGIPPEVQQELGEEIIKEAEKPTFEEREGEERSSLPTLNDFQKEVPLVEPEEGKSDEKERQE